MATIPLLFIGHIALAFLLTYLVIIKFSEIRQNISIALVMHLSILPDVDLALQ